MKLIATVSRILMVSSIVASLISVGACGDDPPAKTDTSVADTTGADTDEDAVQTDTVEADLTGQDVVDEDVPTVCEHACLDPQGRNDRRLCPAPVTDWLCTAGCCAEVFKCANDDDCRAEGYTNGQCADDRFDCRCNVSSGACSTWFCGVDADCESGELCIAGTCIADNDEAISLRLVGPESVVLAVGFTHDMNVDGTRPDDAGLLARAVTATFASASDAIATVDADGVITAVAVGSTTITASLEGSAPVTVNVSVVNIDAGDALTVVALTERTREPVAGIFVVTDASGTVLTTDDIPTDGVIRFASTEAGPFDLHIFADEHDWISWQGLAKATVLQLSVALAAYGSIELDMAAEIVAENTILNHVGLIRGVPDYGNYKYEGALELVLTSGALSTALFDFSLPALLGADVKRFLDPDHNIPRVNAAESLSVPGGVVFGLAGPAIPDFALTAPRGKIGIWSLGGKLDINDVAEYSGAIVDALSGGSLDFTQIVGAVFPLLRNFWSGYNPAVIVATAGDPSAVVTYNPVLTTPMSFNSATLIPALPAIGTLGYADALFLLGGAQTSDGFMVPLGLNGGADTSDKETNPADGFADADERTPARDPFAIPFAALHSGLQGPFTRFMSVAVAVSIPAGSSDPRPSAGSATLSRFAPGEKPPAAFTAPDFLAFPATGTFNPETRTIVWADVDGADLQRVLIKGKRGRHWTVYGANNTFTFPTPSDFGVTEDRLNLEAMESLLINSIDFDAAVNAGNIGKASGTPFDLLLTVVNRVSFLDVRKARPVAQ